MGNVFYVSDLHIGHTFVAGLREYASIDEHDADIAETWRETIGPRDVVWILGDLSLNHDKGLNWLRELPGTKHLVSGNHDRCHPGHRDGFKYLRRYMEVFESVQPFARHRIDGANVLLSHFPYSADHTAEPREVQWRLRDEGLPLLHGHTHSTQIWTSERELHVGWDAWGTLVPREEVSTKFGLAQSGLDRVREAVERARGGPAPGTVQGYA